MNTQRMTLDLSKKHSTKPTIYVGRGDRGGTRLLATITDTGIPLALDGMDVSLSLPLGDVVCEVDGSVATCEFGEELVPDGTEHAYILIATGERAYSTQRMRVVTLTGYTEA